MIIYSVSWLVSAELSISLTGNNTAAASEITTVRIIIRVPDDIELFDTQKIVKQLLGGTK